MTIAREVPWTTQTLLAMLNIRCHRTVVAGPAVTCTVAFGGNIIETGSKSYRLAHTQARVGETPEN